MQKKNIKYNAEFSIFIVQITVVLLILITVIIIKLINGEWFNYLKGFYIGNFSSDTKISDIIDTKEEDIVYLSNSDTYISAMSTGIISNITNKLEKPLDSLTITSGYGYRNDPFGSGIEFHKGIDLSGESGENIYASLDGIVEISQYSKSYGNYMVIKHAEGLKTLYAHSSKNLKKVGDTVKKGDVIATVGATGRSTGPHLHFEIILNNKNLNPEWLLSK